MKNITMTELNQHISSITREVIERGEPVVVTKRGQPVLRLVPEVPAADDPLAALVAAGKATPPSSMSAMPVGRVPITLSRTLDELLSEERADAEF
ncbi:type II toxin-antitoxin system Phd/YefM family antitoxin [Corynebacterium variabile]|uniref:type II toxin-antitoxin system Phd/YefM family antitoxin n=1 Tax=Corynebacterium variabile TaxID=1727 RepID=UPI00265656DA|nr:type II toxin-antitoxin system prevent-host-death family antitoxin [Corynebacterium variabile]MDN6660235.1 type II toxin-antitoxin system prevent-host-death family antitoxin [Acidipropionibacterium jensenii]